MPSRDQALLHPLLQPLCRQFISRCQQEGIHAFVTQTYRSADEQDALYEQGRSLPGAIVTNAKGGSSAHNCTLADGTPAAKGFDFAIKSENGQLDWNADDDQWIKARAIGEALGLYSGEHFPRPDYDHFELTDWKTIA